MKCTVLHILKVLSVAGVLFVRGPLVAQVPVVPSADILMRPFSERDEIDFISPPRVFYPATYFFYLGGNVSVKGITADLEAIATAGFSGIFLFHGQIGGVWPGTDSQIACLSSSWDHTIKHTAEECKRLGLRFTMQGCPGWAMAGGPWIKPSNAMRHLVWSRTDITTEDGVLCKELPIPQPSDEDWRDYKDVAVLAFPTPGGDTGMPLLPAQVTSNVDCEWRDYFLGQAKEPLRLSPSATDKPYWIEITYPEETIVRTVEFPSINSLNHGWNYEPGVNLRVEAVLSGEKAVEILNTELPRSNWQDDRPVSLSCIEKKGVKKFRISITNKYDMSLGSLRLFTAARNNNWESKAGWTLRSMERKGDSVSYSPDIYLKADQIYDLSDRMNKAGVLESTVQTGKWTILRIGHVNTGMRNSPAPAEGTGWECDKLSTQGSDAQFDGYLGRLSGNDGPLANGLLNGALFDSWECKTQTWTDQMEQEFEKRTNYPLRKWLPAVFGYMVDDKETTMCFLNDWRRSINDLFVNNFYGNMARRSKEKGMSISYETAAGDVFPADILEYYKYADVPMCEFWQPFSDGFVGSLNFKSIKPTASAAHLYGKPRVSAEAFTSFSHTWDERFQMLKEVANVNLIEGVSHLTFHAYTHNPQVGFLAPGTSFSGAGIGTPFLRGQTWWKYMPVFNTYFARCTYLLERGKPVSDVLWYLGDEIEHKPDQAATFPMGYKYDYCNPDVLLNRLSVKDGRIMTPEGLSYNVLWLPETTRMLPETLEKLYSLIKDGAVVVGNAPHGLATLVGKGGAQSRFNTYVRLLWGKNATVGEHRIGKGRVVSGMSLSEALHMLGIEPDVKAENALWVHRKIDHADWYYVCAPKGKGYKGVLDFRSIGKVQLWDPVGGKIKDIPSKQLNNRTLVSLDLPQAGSCFIVFKTEERNERKMKEKEVVSTLVLNRPWELRFPLGWGAPASVVAPELKPWKDLDLSPEGKAFSGTVKYLVQFDVDRVDNEGAYQLDLGQVEQIAEVYFNEKRVGVVWTPPYVIDVTGLVRRGENSLMIEVTNTWFNRLVYDANRPEAERKTWVLKWPDKNALLRSSGLLGPVSLRVEK